MKTKEIIDHITEWLNGYLKTSSTQGFVVGVSGGIDSALTSTLACRTGKSTLVLEMPIHQQVSQVNRAQEHIAWLKENFSNVESLKIDLSKTFDVFSQAVDADSSEINVFLALANARARLRMTTLYYHAALRNALVAGTGNKVEDFGVGFYTKYGDGGVDISPIADLMKSEVYALAKELKVAQSIQEAPPTDGLWEDNRTDEDQLGASYDELEWAMKQGDFVNTETFSQREKEVYKRYQSLHSANKHKMVAIPVCEIPKKLK